MKDNWEPVIGLEIHVQLNTRSKLFSSAANRFGDEPNRNITEVCTGQPGAMPVLNRAAVYKAVMFGVAIDANIEEYSRFDRKSYFYPDSPRNFQITQFEKPILREGYIETSVDGEYKKFEIEHAHLEDDAGMLKHFQSFAGIDYNRAGVPLLEIVSKPCMHSAKDASSYAQSIKAIMEYIDSSDCDMEKGHFRMDVNISVRKKGQKSLRTKIEIKNLNSFNFLELAVEKEIKRQIDIYERGEKVVQSTYRWDGQRKELILMRTKESAEDYRYFPEPDIPPVIISSEYIEDIKKALPELPSARLKRYKESLGLSDYNASVLVANKKLSDYFEEGLKDTKNAKMLCSLITVEFTGKLKDQKKSLTDTDIPPKNIASLVNLIDSKKITGRIAKSVADDMIRSPKKTPEDIVKANPDYQPLSDEKEIEKIVDEVLRNNPESIKAYKEGKKKALAALIGQVMKKTKGKANPSLVNELILKKIS